MPRKLILSRKGFDSSAGGRPSFIYGDRLITLPIPGDARCGISYDQLRFDDKVSLKQVMSEVEISDYQHCHLDLDLHYWTHPKRHKQWKAAFGQAEQQEARLQKGKVGVGDIFLFYGWYKQIRSRSGRFEYIKNSRNLHVIYGYMVVDEVFDLGDPKLEVPTLLDYHPHVVNRSRYGRKNRIYCGADTGIFQYHKDLVLTRDGESRSRWELPGFFENEAFGGKAERRILPNGNVALDFVGRNNQELLITSSEPVLEWANKLMRSVPKCTEGNKVLKR